MVFFVRSRGGGRFYATRGRKLLQRHECEKLRKPTKLKIAASEWRAKGWLPFGISDAEMGQFGQVIAATSLAVDGRFKLRLLEGVVLDPSRPAMYRNAPDLLGHVEIRYLHELSGELTGGEIWALKIG